MSADVREKVKDYYGNTLKSNNDLKTSACCSPDTMPEPLGSLMRQIEPEIVEKFYGCGSPIPPALEGCTILDLGCGTGRDVFLCAALAGPTGRVLGVDMTGAQLAVARKHAAAQLARFGLAPSNVEFLHGEMEDLGALGIASESVDVVISNCVINLSPDKESVFREIFRVLKPGGELLFADIFADRRTPAAWREDQVLVGECLGGAMYVEDFRRMLMRLGVPDSRTMAARRVTIDNPEIAEKTGLTKFESRTVRAFKLASLEDKCEDFGQSATYLGTMPHHPHAFHLDDHHEFVAHKPMLVCGNSAAMVGETRLGRHFSVLGDRTRHFGLFPCGPAPATPDAAMASSCTSGGCC